MRAFDELLETCRARGVKLTPQRLAVFRCLLEHPGHPSAEEIYHGVRAAHPRLSFATVYNTLQLLTELGEVSEVRVDEVRRRYDLRTELHHHAVCRGCSRIVDVHLPPGSPVAAALATAHADDQEFLVEETRVEFTGLCGSCRRART